MFGYNRQEVCDLMIRFSHLNFSLVKCSKFESLYERFIIEYQSCIVIRVLVPHPPRLVGELK